MARFRVRTFCGSCEEASSFSLILWRVQSAIFLRSALGCLPSPRIGATTPIFISGLRDLMALKAGAKSLSLENITT